MTRNARAKFFARFEDQVDPDRILPEAERRRRAQSALKAYMTSLSAKAARQRSAKVVDTDVRRTGTEGGQ
jgi:hypothetical protein